jgi:AraC family transcriptional regulator, transcriptional activator of the genes for pyochelin and ferripyochelin receptors
MSSSATALDFSTFLDAAAVERVVPSGSVPIEGVYEPPEGIQFRSAGRNSQLIQEVVQITEGAFLFACDYSPTGELLHRQVVKDSDWIHIQFRLNGGGSEWVSAADVIQTPARSCTVIRYPKNSLVDRTAYVTDSFRVACLLLSPRALSTLLDTPAARLPKQTLWIADDTLLELRTSMLPLTSHMRLAVNDILSCTYRGTARRMYMRAKSLELLSSVVQALDNSPVTPTRPGIVLSPLDISKLNQARCIMLEEIDNSMTLKTLARRVGLNRTKLALGFKEVFGVCLQAYWRDERLTRARELLQSNKARVTDIALSLGYSEVSSFTRAFRRKFGLLPRALRRPKTTPSG